MESKLGVNSNGTLCLRRIPLKEIVWCIVLVGVMSFIYTRLSYNTTQMSSFEQPRPGRTYETDSIMELNVIKTFPLLTADSLKTYGFKRFNLKAIQGRMEEYLVSLQRTLDSMYVSKVHLLYEDSKLIDFIMDRVTHNKNKLFFYKVADTELGKTALEYAFSHLYGHLVMICHSDVYPIDGLDLIKKDVMISKKLMYAITRNGRLERHCNMRDQYSSNSCVGGRYIGSHDAYIFVPMDKLPPKELQANLAIPNDSNGIDGIHIWFFRSVLQYKVINPCKVIKLYHLHCINVRKGGRKRYNTKYNSGRAQPTTSLT